jgi:hypothetical protein
MIACCWRMNASGPMCRQHQFHRRRAGRRAPVRGHRAAITAIHADAAGDDRGNLNGEYALVRNTGAAAVNLAGWKLDAGDRSQRFSLASYLLKKGATVRIHTGRGTSRAGHLYLGLGRPIWNNDGDTGTLIDPHNVAMSRYRY